MQTLFVKLPGGGTKEVKIHRSWKDGGGSEIFLHVNGRYAHKDGAPLKRREDLDILPAIQRKQAQRWWDAVGQAESAKYYKRQEDAAEAEAGDFRDVLVESTELDAALYTRKKAKGGAVSSPKAWMEFFTKRPDWWGQARLIEFGDYVYELAVLEEKAEAETGDFRDVLVESTELDALLYTRTKEKGGAISAPKTWMEFFTQRPDWWGRSRRRDLGNYVYELSDLEEKAAAAAEAKAEAKAEKAAEASADKAANHAGHKGKE